MKMVIDGLKKKNSNADPALIKLIAKAHLLKTELEGGMVDSIKAFAAKHTGMPKTSSRYPISLPA